MRRMPQAKESEAGVGGRQRHGMEGRPISLLLQGLLEDREHRVFVTYWRHQHTVSSSGPASFRDVGERLGLSVNQVRRSLEKAQKAIRSSWGLVTPSVIQSILDVLERSGGVLATPDLLERTRDAGLEGLDVREVWVARGILRALGGGRVLFYHAPGDLWLTRLGHDSWVTSGRLQALESMITSLGREILRERGGLSLRWAEEKSPFGASHALYLVLGRSFEYQISHGFALPLGRTPSRVGASIRELLPEDGSPMGLDEVWREALAHLDLSSDKLPSKVFRRVLEGTPGVELDSDALRRAPPREASRTEA